MAYALNIFNGKSGNFLHRAEISTVGQHGAGNAQRLGALPLN